MTRDKFTRIVASGYTTGELDKLAALSGRLERKARDVYHALMVEHEGDHERRWQLLELRRTLGDAF